jgi:predicted ATPase
VGENGSGKSTPIEALAQAYGLNPEGGSRSAMRRTRHTESPLGGVLRLVRTPEPPRRRVYLRHEHRFHATGFTSSSMSGVMGWW